MQMLIAMLFATHGCSTPEYVLREVHTKIVAIFCLYIEIFKAEINV